MSRSLRLHGLRVGQNELNELVDLQQNVFRLIDQGQLRIQLSHTFPLAEAAAAHRLLEQGSVLGKIALTIPE